MSISRSGLFMSSVCDILLFLNFHFHHNESYIVLLLEQIHLFFLHIFLECDLIFFFSIANSNTV